LTVHLYLYGLALILAGALAGTLLPARSRVSGAALLGSIGCAMTLIAATRTLLDGQTSVYQTSTVLPFTGVHLLLDPFGALFIVVTAVLGIATSLYGVGYARKIQKSRIETGMFPLFLACLVLVPVAASVVTFMVAWELMAATSFLLLLAEHRSRPEARDAAQWYAAMTQFGAAAILIGLVVLAAHAGSQSFAVIRLHAPGLSLGVRSTVFLLVLIGFASKAGAVPLHVWLPRAHAEAASPVSALMSGAMVNLGIYGIIRVGNGLLGGGVLWWWLVVLAIGVASALYGAVQAVASSDLKRLLAFSTIDNIGLVLIGVGAAGALADTGHRLLAALAMLAALFHLTNHAAFKGCLFLAAGSVQHATGTRDLDHLGGLVRRMPATAFLFGIASLSISALPPFNGFASEWLLFQGLLHGFATKNSITAVALLAGVGALALTGGLTAAAFVKALGIGFLGQPRTPDASTAHEVAPSMISGMVLLAIPCVVLGIIPGVVLPVISRATDVGLGGTFPRSVQSGLGLRLSGLSGMIEPVLLLLALLSALILAWGVLQLVARHSARGQARSVEAWGSGRALLTPKMEYTATSFAEPLQRVFVDVLRPSHDAEVTHVAESRYFEHEINYRLQIDDAIERSWYRPLIRYVMAWGNIARRVQNGSTHRYLAFGFIALVVILVVLA